MIENGTLGHGGSGVGFVVGKGGHGTTSDSGKQQPPPIKAQKHSGIPTALRGIMSSFPSTMRIPSLLKALKTVLHIWVDKMKYDQNCDSNGVERKTMPQFVYFFLVKKYER